MLRKLLITVQFFLMFGGRFWFNGFMSQLENTASTAVIAEIPENKDNCNQTQPLCYNSTSSGTNIQAKPQAYVGNLQQFEKSSQDLPILFCYSLAVLA